MIWLYGLYIFAGLVFMADWMSKNRGTRWSQIRWFHYAFVAAWVFIWFYLFIPEGVRLGREHERQKMQAEKSANY